MKNNKHTSGFSLIELVIAIAVLVILTGILVPSFNRMMERGREAKDVACMDAARDLALAYYTEGGVVREYNKSFFYDAATGQITENVPDGYGKGTAANGKTTATFNSTCTSCQYLSTTDYTNDYLTVYYDETQDEVHVHWSDMAYRGSQLVSNIEAAFKAGIFSYSKNDNTDYNTNQMDSNTTKNDTTMNGNSKVNAFRIALAQQGYYIPSDINYWAYKQNSDKKTFYLAWTEEDISSKKEDETIKVIQYNSKSGKYTVGLATVKTNNGGKDYNGSYNYIQNITSIQKDTTNKDNPFDTYEAAIAYYKTYLNLTTN